MTVHKEMGLTISPDTVRVEESFPILDRRSGIRPYFNESSRLLILRHTHPRALPLLRYYYKERVPLLEGGVLFLPLVLACVVGVSSLTGDPSSCLAWQEAF